MNFIKTMMKLQLTLSKKDKITFFWSTLIPILFIFINLPYYKEESKLILWMNYSIIIAFTYRIGIQALSEKDSGSLAVIFSIQNKPFEYFLSLLISQIIYSSITLLILDLFALTMGYNFFILLKYSILCIVVCIPVAFIFYNITYLKSAFASTLNTITAIGIGLLILLLDRDTALDNLNIFKILNEQVKDLSSGIFPFSLVISLALVLLSIPSILRFFPISSERR